MEADLVYRARQGDQAAWSALVQQHQEALFRLAYLMVGDADEAQDIAQEAFIRAYRLWDRFDSTRPLRPWLLRITSNLARNHRRGAGRYWAALVRLVQSEAAGEEPDSAETINGQQMEARALWQAVKKLDGKDQQVIYLRFFLDLPVAEVAETLELPPGTVKSRLHRALERLRGVIERDFPVLREERLP
ncbi:MAG: RNA polymerase sigma factor [Chloroflexi bacterium]|nr:RNA polymerase sigma factor [Chloroflexota bacterium]